MHSLACSGVAACDRIQKTIAQIDIDAVIFFCRLALIDSELLLILLYQKLTFGRLRLKHDGAGKNGFSQMFVHLVRFLLFPCPVKKHIQEVE